MADRGKRPLPGLLVEAVIGEGLREPVLFAGADAAHASQALAAEGTVWLRRAGWPGVAPTPWPTKPPGGQPYGAACLRLPRAGDEIAMTLHAVASVLAVAAPLYVYGGNDEGIRSAAAKLTPMFEDCETLLTKHHARVLRARRTIRSSALKAGLSAWRSTSHLDIGGTGFDWVSYPGVFAHGRLDPGTALLIECLPSLPESRRILDFACGSGLLARAVLLKEPNAEVDMLDADTVALVAARENVPEAQALLGTSLSDCRGRRYDLIVSNPPIHDGRAVDLGVVKALISGATENLKAGGSLLLVVQRTVPVPRFAESWFAQVTLAAERGGYRVWRLTAPVHYDQAGPSARKTKAVA